LIGFVLIYWNIFFLSLQHTMILAMAPTAWGTLFDFRCNTGHLLILTLDWHWQWKSSCQVLMEA